MKKQLQSQIKSLAEQILSENDSKNTKKMKETARKLYEQLSVLEYLEVQILGEEEPKVQGSLDSKSYRENNWFKEPEPVPQPEDREALIEPVMEKIKDLVAQMPEESQKVDALLEEVLPRKEYHKNDLEEFASSFQEMPVFERKEETATSVKMEKKIEVELDTKIETKKELEVLEESTFNDISKPKSLNDSLTRGIHIGLNDRLAFIKHLFDGKTEDYTRVLSQINTQRTFQEAQDFIKGKVKPSYNYWLNKDEYTKRFMKIIEKSYS
ncbi:MAG: hypothetical protein JKY22_08240 [Flavobacteriaceae bacterium]|nr:hypothetical protein [Flavobacteriaceae bacterium]